MELSIEKNKPIRVAIIDQNGDLVDLSPLVGGREGYNEFVDVSIPSGDQTVISYLVPINKTLYVQGFNISGTAESTFILGKSPATPLGGGFISSGNPQLQHHYQDGVIEYFPGETLLFVISHAELSNQSFKVNVFGYLETVTI